MQAEGGRGAQCELPAAQGISSLWLVGTGTAALCQEKGNSWLPGQTWHPPADFWQLTRPGIL